MNDDLPAGPGRQPADEEEAAAELHLPRPSVWPAVLAAGIGFMLFGIVTSYWFSAFGVVVMVWALAGWVGELLHE
jgi:hypothetical protein